MVDERVKEVLRKYEGQIEKAMKTEGQSKEYIQFKKEIIPNLSSYEKLAKGAGKILNLRLKGADEERLQSDIEAANLDITPKDAAAFAIASFVSTILISLLIVAGLFLAGINVPVAIIAFFLLIAIFAYYYTNTLPKKLAMKWRLKASSQMVPCILYIVVYMKHTSNLELAIKFASEHLPPPLSLDLEKLFWDVETGKYHTLKAALDAYLEKWRGYSLEFVEAFHLIESSLYEPSETRRIEILEKSLNVILDGVYDKMLKYTHSIQSPLTNLYMLGIVLPTLAIALLPLASTLVGDVVKWYYVALFFNIIVPFLVYYYASDILSKRPGGYGESELLELNPGYGLYKSRKHIYKALAIAIPLLLIGLIPLLFFYTPLPSLFGLEKDYTFSQLGIPLAGMGDFNIFDFKANNAGPFGLVALLLSLMIPLAVALFFYLDYRSKSKRLLETRDQTKKLENEFASSLFQLGNRLGDGIPAEMAFGRVAESLKGTPTEGFFRTVNSNIAQLGMSVREAIFNPQRGAIIYYPSSLVKTSMEILVESVKKGLTVAANALMSISEYVKNIQKIEERLKDLLADIISSMKSNISFLAPLLAGIVVGLSAMITIILNKLSLAMQAPGGADQALGGIGTVGSIVQLFDLTKMIPPYYLQLIVGIYVVEIIYILSITLVTVESGSDELGEKYEIAQNMKSGMLMYSFSALISIIGLALLSALAVGGLVTP